MSKFIIFIGPSGAGKTILAKYYVDNYNAELIISTTNRPIREGEVDKIDYYFKSKEEINKMISNNEFVEYAQYASNIYGTSKEELNEKISKNQYLSNVMEMEGALKIKELYPETILIYCYCPVDVLMQRMFDRGDSFDSIKKRVKNIFENKEYDNKDLCDYIINTNCDFEDSYKQLDSIINKI